MAKLKGGTLAHYLSVYAEPEARNLPETPKANQFVLVIPAYQECLSDIEAVFTHLSDLSVVLVVNGPSANDNQALELLSQIQRHWQRQSSLNNMTWYLTALGHPVLVVDRVSEPINAQFGVGLARKIGADIAVALIQSGDITFPRIFNTDADAVLPPDYLLKSVQDDMPAEAFQLYPFDHLSDGDRAAELYQFSLLWYPLGLKYAGSNYGFPSIGSTISCQAESYVKVRGYPKRAAGEDFYLLNKLRKVGNFRYVNSESIRLSTRRSQRVPFGTGPSLRKIDQLNDDLEFTFYHPAVFEELKQFLKLLQDSYHCSDLKSHFADDLSREFVETNKLETLLLRQQKQTLGVYTRFLDDWFDGFRTLKFVHLARDRKYKSVGFRQLWDSHVLPIPCPGSETQQIQAGKKLAWEALIAD